MAPKHKKSSDSRYYSVRPEWVWSDKNKGLTKVAALKITLSHPSPHWVENALASWLKTINATNAGNGQYYMGGCGLDILSQTSTDLVMILSSGGQDALESLDYSVDGFYESIIAPNIDVSVIWEELPLYS